MNALELADKLEQKALTADAMEYGFEVDFKQAATMLRQQQAELDRAVELYTDKAIENEALKAGKIRAYDNGVEDGRKPNTHPVSQYKAITNTKIEPTVVSYTHPVKELTDEEIEEFEHLIAKAFDFSTQIKVVGLDRIIRAILRKAQEK